MVVESDLASCAQKQLCDGAEPPLSLLGKHKGHVLVNALIEDSETKKEGASSFHRLCLCACCLQMLNNAIQ